MKYCLLSFLLPLVFCGYAQLKTTSMHKVDSMMLECPTTYSSIVRTVQDGKTFYTIEGMPYTGCVTQTFPGNVHRYRFFKIGRGYLEQQIGYYQNGSIDHIFNQKNGLSHGRERMWREDGTMYIDNNYVNGLPEGLQKRWYSNNRLAMEALYKNGKLVYEHLYGEDGKLLEEHSTIKKAGIGN